MAKKYYRWKDENCNGVNPEWVQMTGKQFKEFKDENRLRKFIQIGGEFTNDDILFMEVTPEQYKTWKRDNNRAEYRRRLEYELGAKMVSFDEEIDGTEEMTRHEVIADDSVNVENTVEQNILIENLRLAIKTLSAEEYDLIYAMFLSESPMNERDYADLLGMSKTAINYRKKIILKKLKVFLDQN